MLSHVSHVQLSATPSTVAARLLCPWDFPARILEWLLFLPPGDLPDPGTESESLMSPTLAGMFFTTSDTWEPKLRHVSISFQLIMNINYNHGYKKTMWNLKHSTIGPLPWWVLGLQTQSTAEWKYLGEKKTFQKVSKSKTFNLPPAINYLVAQW